jgi:hypothetical protein
MISSFTRNKIFPYIQEDYKSVNDKSFTFKTLDVLSKAYRTEE